MVMCMVIYNVKTVGGALLDKMIGMSINYSTWSNGSSTSNCYGNGLLLNGRRANIYATAVTQFINTNMHLSGSGTHLRLKSHEMSFDLNLFLGCSTVLKFGSTRQWYCHALAKFKNGSTIEFRLDIANCDIPGQQKQWWRIFNVQN